MSAGGGAIGGGGFWFLCLVAWIVGPWVGMPEWVHAVLGWILLIGVIIFAIVFGGTLVALFLSNRARGRRRRYA